MASFRASIEELYKMLQFIKRFAASLDFDEQQILQIEIAAEEALVNIIHYAYPKKEGFIEIICGAYKDLGIEIRIIDEGIPYNPLVDIQKENDLFSLEEKIPGGYGISIIKKIMNHLVYRFEGNKNILSMIRLRMK